ncbi:GNAT family N-acetyltransferase [Planctomycetes bacterium K23_9]|uniref:Putative acetyltransferase n=1 Tax=Stieleria marina TaxID=1930275 RepID=A0A517NZ28_9BACT|nr:putative acetyltransferase [Planctomycetes bacterium K23_9]
MTKPQLKMTWPVDRLADPPTVTLPSEYSLRLCAEHDETAFVALMHGCGWDDWDSERLAYCKSRLLPEGWFVVIEDASEELVGSAMSLHNYSEKLPYSGTLGWVGCAPNHRGRGIGSALASAATARMIEGGYRHIELYTEHFRTAALRSYLRLGYVPYLYNDAVANVWQEICATLSWPFTPKAWPVGDDAFPSVVNE